MALHYYLQVLKPQNVESRHTCTQIAKPCRARTDNGSQNPATGISQHRAVWSGVSGAQQTGQSGQSIACVDCQWHVWHVAAYVHRQNKEKNTLQCGLP